MITTFDPYYKWLGIPPAEQPPNYYRLLGINLFESDCEVIESGADQRMSHLMTFQSGDHAELAQQLLDEIATVKVRLLRPEQKFEYDVALRTRLALRAPPVIPMCPACGGVSPPPVGCAIPSAGEPAGTGCTSAKALSVATDTFETDGAVELESLGISDPALRHSRRAPHLPPIVWLMGPTFFVVIAVLGAVLIAEARKNVEFQNHAAADVARADKARGETQGQRRTPSDSTPPVGQALERSTTAGAVDKTVPPKTDGAAGELHGPDDATRPGGIDQPQQFGSGADKPTANYPPDNQPPTGQPDLAEVAPNPNIEAPPPKVPDDADKPPALVPGVAPAQRVTGDRLPIPSDPAQQGALREIRKVMRDEFADAKTVSGQQTLAHKLDELATDTADDPILRYELMSQALDFATRSGDVQLTADLVARLPRFYDLDAWQLRLKTCTRLSQTALTAEGRSRLVQDALQFIADAQRDNRYEVAVEFASLATNLSALVKDKGLRDRARDCAEQAKRMQAVAAQASAALDRLLMRPDDAEANLIMGKFRCFDKDDWQGGLPFLVRGADYDLQELARQELKRPSAPLDQVKLADAWWELAERIDDNRGEPTREPARIRAIYWYRKASPNLTGLALLKAQKRIAENDSKPIGSLTPDVGPHRTPRRGASSATSRT